MRLRYARRGEENPTYDILHHAKVSDVITPKAVITLDSEDTVEKAVKNHIQSAPVVNSKTNEVLGMVDMLDIVAFILSVAPSGHQLSANALKTMEIAGRAMALETLKNVVDFSGRDPYVPITTNSPLTYAATLFRQGIHRLPVVDEHTKAVQHIVSQSALIRFIHEKDLHRGHLKEIGHKTIGQLGLGTGGVVSSPLHDSVFKVLHALRTGDVSAVALVNDTGKLAGNFSATDLKGLYDETMPKLLDTAEDYLEKFSPSSLKPACVRLDTTVADAVKAMVEDHVHRLWVIDDDFKPTGVITMTDLNGLFVNKAL